MGYRLDPFKVEDIDGMRLPLERKSEMSLVNPDSMHLLQSRSSVSYTLRCGDRIIASAGVVSQTPWIGSAWAFVSSKVGFMDIATLTRTTNTVLDSVVAGSRVHRIETSIPDGFERGFKWARMLGFRREGLMRRYDPDGNDHWLYSRI